MWNNANDRIVYYPLDTATQNEGEDRPPSEAPDAAWEAHLQSAIASIPEHQAARMPNLTIPITDEPGHFIIELDIACAYNMIRKTFYPDHYPATNPKTVGKDAILSFSHIDHCIESIQQSIKFVAARQADGTHVQNF